MSTNRNICQKRPKSYVGNFFLTHPEYVTESVMHCMITRYTVIFSATDYNLQGGPKIGTEEKISNNSITKDPTTSCMCKYTTL